MTFVKTVPKGQRFGLISPVTNITLSDFFINDGTQIIANKTITKVWLINDPFATNENIDNTQKKTYILFPNSVKNKFQISIDGNMGEGAFTIQIKNINS